LITRSKFNNQPTLAQTSEALGVWVPMLVGSLIYKTNFEGSGSSFSCGTWT